MKNLLVCLLVCGVWALSTAEAASPRASSELRTSEGERHGAVLAFDGLLQTGWAEGSDGLGDGAWIELPLSRATDISSVSVWPGNLSKGSRSLREYSRPRTVTVELHTVDGSVVSEEVRFQDGAKIGPKRIDVPIQGKARKVRLTVDDSFEGGVFTDVFIAEIALNFEGGRNPRIVEQLDKWQDSSSGKRAEERNSEQIIELYETISGAEFGDRDALQEIMDRAGDGAPYMRERVRKLVPAGYRVQALPPDPVAITALLKLKDANSIPAIEMASLRVGKKDAKKLTSKVEIFYAYQELSSGGDRNIPYWGKSGWEPGALRAFDEPMGVEIDQMGSVYVADIGNHRVVRFNTEGRHEQLWGAEAGITDRWFRTDRTYYVGGSAPSEKPGEFVNPVDVVLLPGKEADGFAVLDALGRIQLFDANGRNTIGWNIRSDEEISPGVGGEGYLLHSKGKLVAIWGNEAFVYATSSEELGTWKIEDGVPNAAETLKNGKLALVFGRDLIQYSVDGFRHGKILDETDLGEGLEDWDISLDEKSKLWVITDTGWAIKYKRPGKIDYKVQVSEVDLIQPRLAVMDDLLFIVERDRVLVADALEIKRKAELAEEEAAKQAAEEDGS